MKRFFIVLLSLALFSNCRTVKIDVPPPPPSPVSEPEPVTFPTTINATTTGVLSISGVVAGGGYSASSASTPDQQLTLSDARSGNEAERSCGSQWTQSQARSVAQITPRSVPQGHIYGSAVNVSTQARGGFWRGKVVFACSGSNNECGNAFAQATAFTNLNYTAPRNIKDQLIIRINGDPNTVVKVQEVGGNVLDVVNTAGGRVVELPHSGAYTISSSVSTTTNPQCGGCAGCIATTTNSAEVLVQSLRDALNPVGADDLYQVPLPVFIPVNELQNQLYDALFKEGQGRFYPCPQKSECGKYASGIYLENPQVSVNGSFLTIKVHLTGHASFFIFRPGITGDIYLTATPVVENDTLFFRNVTLEVQSRNMILKYVTQQFADKLVSGIQSKAAFPLKPKFDELLTELKKQFPIKWGSACLLLDVDKIKLKQVYPKPSPKEGIVADFGISIQIKDESFCN